MKAGQPLGLESVLQDAIVGSKGDRRKEEAPQQVANLVLGTTVERLDITGQKLIGGERPVLKPWRCFRVVGVVAGHGREPPVQVARPGLAEARRHIPV